MVTGHGLLTVPTGSGLCGNGTFSAWWTTLFAGVTIPLVSGGSLVGHFVALVSAGFYGSSCCPVDEFRYSCGYG